VRPLLGSDPYPVPRSGVAARIAFVGQSTFFQACALEAPSTAFVEFRAGADADAMLARVRAFAPDALIVPWWVAFWAPQVWTIARLAKPPLIFRGDSHRLARRGGVKEQARRAVIARIFRRFSAFLYVGKANERYFRYHGVAHEKLFFAPHAVDNQRFFGEHGRRRGQAVAQRQGFNVRQ